jgi:hypothetical protein
MSLTRVLFVGTAAGLVMGVSLFMTGAIAAFLVYGPRMAPAGKFESAQMNPVYFFWTKLCIGWFFGLVFTFVYARLLAVVPFRGVLRGILFTLGLWLIISLWGVSHPLVYETVATSDRLFWHIYTLGGFLGYGLALGLLTRGVGLHRMVAAGEVDRAGGE